MWKNHAAQEIKGEVLCKAPQATHLPLYQKHFCTLHIYSQWSIQHHPLKENKMRIRSDKNHKILKSKENMLKGKPDSIRSIFLSNLISCNCILFYAGQRLGSYWIRPVSKTNFMVKLQFNLQRVKNSELMF